MKQSQHTARLLGWIGSQATPGQPVRTLNALGTGPLAYRTFGGHPQRFEQLEPAVMDRAFTAHYLLTMFAQALIIRLILYPEPDSRHTLYTDASMERWLERHGILACGLYDQVDIQTLAGLTGETVDFRIYYSYVKPDAIAEEARRARLWGKGTPVLFVDTDLILKKRHDAILPGVDSLQAAYGHLEKIGTDCYPDFPTLRFPQGYRLPADFPMDLPAVNTCLMYFKNLELAEDWCAVFKEMFLHNFLDGPVDPATVSRQLLGIDQRTFPMVAHRHGLWSTDAVAPFLDVVWDPPHFTRRDGSPAHWHFYTLEHRPEHPEWLQDITHTWIAKKDVERDPRFCGYQCCLLLELILTLMPQAESALRSFDSLLPYFQLFSQYGGLDQMLASGAVSDRLQKIDGGGNGA